MPYLAGAWYAAADDVAADAGGGGVADAADAADADVDAFRKPRTISLFHHALCSFSGPQVLTVALVRLIICIFPIIFARCCCC